MNNHPIRILLADDQKTVRHILSSALSAEDDLEVIGSVEDGIAALEQVEALHPDVILVDIEMPEMDGLTAARIMHERGQSTKVLILSSYDDEQYVEKALRSGAQGYLLKSTSPEDLAIAIRSIHKGYLQLGPGIPGKLFTHPPGDVSEVVHSPDSTLEIDAEVLPESDWSSLTRELVVSIPRLWTRGLLYFLGGIAALIVPWAMFAKVDETGTARGRLEPSGKTWRVESPINESITAIHVKEGQTVQAGQLLIEFSAELLKRDLQQSQAKLDGQRNQLAQLALVKNQMVLTLGSQQQQNHSQQLEKQAQVAQAQETLNASQKSYQLESIEKLAPIDQAQQQLSASRNNYAFAKNRIVQDQSEVTRYRKLWKLGVAPETQMIEKERLLSEGKRLLAQAHADLKQAQIRLSEQQRRYKTLLHTNQSIIDQAKLKVGEQQESYQGIQHTGDLTMLKTKEELENLVAQITTLKAEMQQTQSQIKAVEYQLKQRRVRSPVAGTIFELPIAKAGAVVQPGALLAEISPQTSPLTLRAQMPTSDSGSLRKGLPVKLKFDAYPFQNYGVVAGSLSKISPTSKVSETPQGRVTTFDLEITLKQSCISAQKQCITLMPGQTAIAEVIVRQRRIIDYLLDPFR